MKLECWSCVTCKYFHGDKILDAKIGDCKKVTLTGTEGIIGISGWKLRKENFKLDTGFIFLMRGANLWRKILVDKHFF